MKWKTPSVTDRLSRQSVPITLNTTRWFHTLPLFKNRACLLLRIKRASARTLAIWSLTVSISTSHHGKGSARDLSLSLPKQREFRCDNQLLRSKEKSATWTMTWWDQDLPSHLPTSSYRSNNQGKLNSVFTKRWSATVATEPAAATPADHPASKSSLAASLRFSSINSRMHSDDEWKVKRSRKMKNWLFSTNSIRNVVHYINLQS